MEISIVRAIEREEGDRVLAGQFTQNVVAADFSAGVGWNESASFDPENFQMAPRKLFATAHK